MKLGLRLLLALWAGLLVAVGAVAAPTLFHELADRHLAGQLAGALFRVVTLLSIGIAAVLAAAARGRPGAGAGPLRLALPPLLLGLAEWGIRPLLEAARGQAGVAGDAFALWHGVSTLLYVAATAAVVALLVGELRR